MMLLSKLYDIYLIHTGRDTGGSNQPPRVCCGRRVCWDRCPLWRHWERALVRCLVLHGPWSVLIETVQSYHQDLHGRGVAVWARHRFLPGDLIFLHNPPQTIKQFSIPPYTPTSILFSNKINFYSSFTLPGVTGSDVHRDWRVLRVCSVRRLYLPQWFDGYCPARAHTTPL